MADQLADHSLGHLAFSGLTFWDVGSARRLTLSLMLWERQTEPVTQAESQVRLADADDLSAIFRADTLAGAGDRQRAAFLRHCVALGECRVYLDNEVVAGFIIVKPAHFFGRDFIELLMVHPARRRSGIGRFLLREALATAGTDQVFTSTNRSNHPMRSLLETENWTFSGELDGLDEGDPEVVFYKNRLTRTGHRTD